MKSKLSSASVKSIITMSTEVETVLKGILDKKKLAHALLFVGADLKEMVESAFSFIKEVFERTSNQLNHGMKVDHLSHPDVKVYTPGSKTGIYTIEQVKEICDQSNLYPSEASKQFFILKYAHRMHDAAANALLKTLEEPAENSIFILMVESTDQLLPTIVSRTYPIFFQNVQVDESKLYHQKLLQLLSLWPQICYHDLLTTCEEIQKLLEEEMILQKEKIEDEVAFIDKETSSLFIQVEKWYQKNKFCEQKIMIDPKTFAKTMEQVQSALKRSIKPAICLEYLLLQFVS